MRRSIRLLLTGCVLCAPTLLYAQQSAAPAASDDDSQDAIVVTGYGRDQRAHGRHRRFLAARNAADDQRHHAAADPGPGVQYDQRCARLYGRHFEKGRRPRGVAAITARGFEVQNFQLDGAPFENGNVGFGETSTAQYEARRSGARRRRLMQGAGDPSAVVNLIRKHANAERIYGRHQPRGRVVGPLRRDSRRPVAAQCRGDGARARGGPSLYAGQLRRSGKEEGPPSLWRDRRGSWRPYHAVVRRKLPARRARRDHVGAIALLVRRRHAHRLAALQDHRAPTGGSGTPPRFRPLPRSSTNWAATGKFAAISAITRGSKIRSCCGSTACPTALPARASVRRVTGTRPIPNNGTAAFRRMAASPCWAAGTTSRSARWPAASTNGWTNRDPVAIDPIEDFNSFDGRLDEPEWGDRYDMSGFGNTTQAAVYASTRISLIGGSSSSAAGASAITSATSMRAGIIFRPTACRTRARSRPMSGWSITSPTICPPMRATPISSSRRAICATATTG